MLIGKEKTFILNNFKKQFNLLEKRLAIGFEERNEITADITLKNNYNLSNNKIKDGFYLAKIVFKKKEYKTIIFVKNNKENSSLMLNIFDFQNLYNEKITIELLKLVLQYKYNHKEGITRRKNLQTIMIYK